MRNDNREIHEALTMADAIPGQVTTAEGVRLFELARRARIGAVEVGSHLGRSTGFLAKGSQYGNNVPVFAVDHFGGSQEHRARNGGQWLDTFPQFKANMELLGVSDLVVPVVAHSTSYEAEEKMKGRKFDLLFLDGSHDVKSVREDLRFWLERMDEGGTLAMHDTFGSWTAGPGLAAVGDVLLSDRFSEPVLTDSLLDVSRYSSHGRGTEIDMLRMAVKLVTLGPFASIKPRLRKLLGDLGVEGY